MVTWDFHGFSMDFHGFPWIFHGIFMDFHGFSMDFHGIFMGFSLDFHGILIGFDSFLCLHFAHESWAALHAKPGAPRGRPTMPSVVAFNARGDSIAGLKANRVKADGQKQVKLVIY